ncbi:MAG: MFS transporter [Candidatus Omnitrophota bacterium]|jgi:MFS family permease
MIKKPLKSGGKVHRSLKVSLFDGIFASCMTGLTADYITPYALALKAQVFQIGMLTALPNLISSLVQLKSADLAEKAGSRKKVIVGFVFLHVLMGIPIILVPYIFKGYEVAALIVCITLFASFNAIAAPVWQGLMSDYLPYRKRGRYFGWRNKITGVITICCVFIAGFILQIFRADVLRGFLIILSLAFICRFISWCFLIRMYEPKMRHSPEAYFSFFDFVKRAKQSNFVKFVFLVACMNFTVSLASPFFSVFMLRDLKLSYLTYTILVGMVSIASILTIGRWGKSADRFGNLKIIRLTALLIALVPFLWILNHHAVYIGLVQAFAGFAWAGFNLCAINFIYDAATPEKRTRCISYFNVFNGIALCLGPLMGSYLARHLPNIFGFRLLSLFFLSGVLRLVAVLFISRTIKEVRGTEHIASRDLLYNVIGIKPVLD